MLCVVSPVTSMDFNWKLLVFGLDLERRGSCHATVVCPSTFSTNVTRLYRVEHSSWRQNAQASGSVQDNPQKDHAGPCHAEKRSRIPEEQTENYFFAGLHLVLIPQHQPVAVVVVVVVMNRGVFSWRGLPSHPPGSRIDYVLTLHVQKLIKSFAAEIS